MPTCWLLCSGPIHTLDRPHRSWRGSPLPPGFASHLMGRATGTYFISDRLHSQGTPPPPCQGRLQRACAFITPLIIKKFLTYCLLFIYLAVPGLSCSLQDLFKLRRMGSSSLTKDCAGDPCIRSQESYPLDHQGSPQKIWKIILKFLSWKANKVPLFKSLCFKDKKSWHLWDQTVWKSHFW